MKTITDKILKRGEVYNDVKFVRCLNLGAELTDCIWEDGYWIYGYWYGGTWESGIWYDGLWKDGTWIDGMWNNGVYKVYENN